VSNCLSTLNRSGWGWSNAVGRCFRHTNHVERLLDYCSFGHNLEKTLTFGEYPSNICQGYRGRKSGFFAASSQLDAASCVLGQCSGQRNSHLQTKMFPVHFNALDRV